ncbi:MAG: hypothetical protein HOP21_04350 [Methylotenera sp.]|nr:hypothetical protein [Methylotenera sp.]
MSSNNAEKYLSGKENYAMETILKHVVIFGYVAKLSIHGNVLMNRVVTMPSSQQAMPRKS